MFKKTTKSESRHRLGLSGKRRGLAALGATAAIAAAVIVPSVPANAVGMASVIGNISCNAAPNIAIGTTATAKGTVEFQLNATNNTGTQSYVSLGYSAAYASWGWKFLSQNAGNFYAYGYGTEGNATSASRYCQNIFS